MMMSAVGDTVHVLPVVNALKRTNPRARITWVLQPGPAALVRGHRSVDDFIIFDRSKGIKAFAEMYSELKARRFDLVIDLQVYLKAGIVTAMTRQNLPLAWKLTYPSLRAGYTYKQWLTGTIPVQYFPAKAMAGASFEVQWSHPNDVMLNVYVFAKPKSGVKSQTFFVELKPVGKGKAKRWLVSYVAPSSGAYVVPSSGDSSAPRSDPSASSSRLFKPCHFGSCSPGVGSPSQTTTRPGTASVAKRVRWSGPPKQQLVVTPSPGISRNSERLPSGSNTRTPWAIVDAT